MFSTVMVFQNFSSVAGPPSPLMGDHLVVVVGLMGSEDPADSAF